MRNDTPLLHCNSNIACVIVVTTVRNKHTKIHIQDSNTRRVDGGPNEVKHQCQSEY